MEKKIFLIDDDPDILEIYGELLRKQGYQVRTAVNTTIARPEIETFQPDLIILDVMMEHADEGFVFAQRLWDEKVRTPVIITSSIARAGQEVFDVDIPTVKAVLQKPVDLPELMALVKKITGA
jgi:DNA-binding response OmpR family regulator